MRRHSQAPGLGTGRAQERHPALERWRGEGRDIRGYVNLTVILWSATAVWKNGDLVLLEENINPEIKAAEKTMNECIWSDLENQHRFALVNNRSLKIAY